MLKFRQSNSAKARRAAESQRKALEEQLKMEWAWKPMAAVMNEGQTDLLYWVPPLYSPNTPSSPSYTPKIQSTPIRSRKKKLGTHRMRTPASSVSSKTAELAEDDEEDVNAYLDADIGKWVENASLRMREDDSESGIHDEYDPTMDTDSLRSFSSDFQQCQQCMKEEKFEKSLSSHPTSGHSCCCSPTARIMQSTADRYLFQQRRDLKPIPEKKPASNLFKLLERFAHLHCFHVQSSLDSKTSFRNETKTMSKKRKSARPSFKVYQGSSFHRKSSRRVSRSSQGARSLQEPSYLVLTSESKKSSVKRKNSLSVGTIGDQKVQLQLLSETEMRNTQLEAMLKILASLYEEKLTQQDSKIESLEFRLSNQEKLVKQTARVVLNLRAEVRSLRHNGFKTLKDQEQQTEFSKRDRLRQANSINMDDEDLDSSDPVNGHFNVISAEIHQQDSKSDKTSSISEVIQEYSRVEALDNTAHEVTASENLQESSIRSEFSEQDHSAAEVVHHRPILERQEILPDFAQDEKYTDGCTSYMIKMDKSTITDIECHTPETEKIEQATSTEEDCSDNRVIICIKSVCDKSQQVDESLFTEEKDESDDSEEISEASDPTINKTDESSSEESLTYDTQIKTGKGEFSTETEESSESRCIKSASDSTPGTAFKDTLQQGHEMLHEGEKEVSTSDDSSSCCDDTDSYFEERSQFTEDLKSTIEETLSPDTLTEELEELSDQDTENVVNIEISHM